MHPLRHLSNGVSVNVVTRSTRVSEKLKTSSKKVYHLSVTVARSRYSKNMVPKKLEEIKESDLDALLANSVSEGKTIDYKAELPGNSGSDRKEFLADVSSFANTVGGDLIFGIAEKRGVPTAIPGLNVSDFDLEIRRLESMIADGIDPRIKQAIRVVERKGKPSLVVIRVDRSWIGPHRVIFGGHDKFYARNSKGKYPLDVSELRSAFTFASSVTDRIRAFRMDRIAKLIANDAPLPFAEGSKTILHCIPFESFAGPVQYDIFKFKDQAHRIPPIVIAGAWGSYINLDGLAIHSGTTESCLSYTQLFRNGAVEVVEGHWLNTGYGGRRRIPCDEIEKKILDYTGKIFEIQKELGVNAPLVVGLTLTGTKDLEIEQNVFSFGGGHLVREEHLILPESVVEDFNEPSGKVLKPMFDLIWNACGFMRSKNFDDEGNWKPQR